MPEQFWSLLVREFWMKHDAFMRREDRALYLAAWSIWVKDRKKFKPEPMNPEQLIGRVLRRYPVKPWLLSD